MAGKARPGPDHILVGLRASDRAAWRERRLIDGILEAFHLPVTVFEVDRAGAVPSAEQRS
jgi:hypothetical protein